MRTLNPAQRQAVRHIEGPLLVLAGAGSGKTRVITRKIAWLIGEQGLEPGTIAALTFTNKAAREMRERVGALLGGQPPRGLVVSTFHSFGLSVLRREHAVLGRKPGFTLMDPADGALRVAELLRAERAGGSDIVESVQYWLSRWKNEGLAPQEIEPDDQPAALAAARVYGAYEHLLKACNSFDLDDLLLKPAQLFAGYPDILAAWRERLRYLLVDEYQDTNAVQYRLLRQLAGPRPAFTVVGDDDQSIYAWRGARPENLAQLRHDYPDLTVVKLEQNYRSTTRILRAANSVIVRNPHLFEKRLWSELGPGEPLRVWCCRDEEHEADRIVTGIQHHRFDRGGDYGNYAILYRGNHQSRAFERVLREHRIPYYVSGGISFFERTEIRDVMAYLRLLANPDDDAAFLRIVNTPRRGLGASTLERLGQLAVEHGLSLMQAARRPELAAQVGGRAHANLDELIRWLEATAAAGDAPVAVVRRMLADIQYRDWLEETTETPEAAARRWENVQELVDWIARLERRDPQRDDSLPAVIAEIVVAGMLEREEDDGRGVALMTLHAAKGLEFPHVFIAGLEEELLPHRSALADGALEEERRLFYVGLTRARQSLTLTLAARRRRYGEVLDCVPSRFLEELPAADLEWEGRETTQDPSGKRARGEACLAGLRARLNEGS